MLRLFWLVLRRDCLLAWRRRGELMLALVFFAVIASLFPLGTRAEPAVLRELAPAVVWIAALLASLMPLQKLFAADWQAGTLEQMVLANEPLPVIAIGRIAAHWLTSGLPLVLAGPLLALQYDLNAAAIGALVLSLLAGTPALSVLGALGAALTLEARGGAALLALLVLPLAVPVMVLGAAAIAAAQAGEDPSAHLMLLAALSASLLAIGPPVLASAWRLAAE